MVQGLGGGLILPVGMAMAAARAPVTQTGSAIGGLQAAFALGVALGPGVAGLFAEELHWRGFYAFLAVAGGVSGAIVALAYSPLQPGGPGRGNPLRPLGQALAVRGVQLVSLTGFLLTFATVGVSIFIAVWLQRGGLLGPAGTGLLISVPGLVGIVASPVAGYLGDRWGVSRAVVLGTGITVVGLAGLFVLPGTLWAYPGLLLLTGMGSAATTTNLGAMSLLRWPQLRQAVSGVFNGARFFGLALAPVAFTPVYQAASIRGVLAVACVVLAFGAGIVMTVRRAR
ncbi:MAG: MFS transporter [Chloroflexi bacterium]|nr:MFS transporter [Chloroflexota bacterium]